MMFDMVEGTVGTAPRVLDLACGTGSITDRLLQRFPAAHSTGVDLDPALLTIARGYSAGDDRVAFVTADLTDPRWPDRLPYDSYDAVLTATALHWLRTDALRTLYGQLAGLVRPGGVFLNADHMPRPATPRINAAEAALRHARQEAARAEGVLDPARVVGAGRGRPGARRADRRAVPDLRRARRRRDPAGRLARRSPGGRGLRRGAYGVVRAVRRADAGAQVSRPARRSGAPAARTSALSRSDE